MLLVCCCSDEDRFGPSLADSVCNAFLPHCNIMNTSFSVQLLSSKTSPQPRSPAGCTHTSKHPI